jgi:mono/diheme cytochrome c family protein
MITQAPLPTTGRDRVSSRRWGAVLLLALGAASISVAVRVRASQSAPSAAPTFNAQIAPILFANCITCHRPGGVAPFSLMTYDDAHARGARIRAMVSARTMPPWYADPQFGQFKNSRALSQTEIDTIVKWVDGDGPQGTGAAPAPPKVQDTGWRVGRPPDQIIELPFGEFQLPPAGEVPAFTVWIKPLTDERFIQAIEIRPSIQGVVHHSSLSLGKLPPDTAIGRGEAFPGGPVLDGVAVYRDGRPFRSAGGEYIADKPVLFYVPGGGLLQLADGLGKRFGRDDYIAWGIHLISPGKPEKLRMQIGLWYARRYPHHEVKTWTVTQTLIAEGQELPTGANKERVFPTIPAGAANWSMTGIMKVKQAITIYSLWPHMHFRGKDMRFVLTLPNGQQQTLLSVPHYNPHWQLSYELAKPLKVRSGSTITAYGHFDNSSANPHNPDPTMNVKFGPQGTDEMFLPFLEVTVDDEDLSFEQFQRQQ